MFLQKYLYITKWICTTSIAVLSVMFKGLEKAKYLPVWDWLNKLGAEIKLGSCEKEWDHSVFADVEWSLRYWQGTNQGTE